MNLAQVLAPNGRIDPERAAHAVPVLLDIPTLDQTIAMCFADVCRMATGRNALGQE